MERETIIFSGGRSMKGTVDKLLNFMKLSDDVSANIGIESDVWSAEEACSSLL